MGEGVNGVLSEYRHFMNTISHDSETLALGQQVITVCAFIHQTFEGVEKVFLPKRATTKKFLPDVFELPGGHVDYAEDIVDGLKREVMEEFGMGITVGDPFAAFTYVNEIKGSHSIEVIYFARFIESIEHITINPEDHSEYGWFAADEIHKIVSANKREEDVEIQAIKKGFLLLEGGQPLF